MTFQQKQIPLLESNCYSSEISVDYKYLTIPIFRGIMDNGGIL